MLKVRVVYGEGMDPRVEGGDFLDFRGGGWGRELDMRMRTKVGYVSFRGLRTGLYEYL